MFIEDEWLIIGEIVAAQGLKGEIRINPKSDFPERFTNPGQRWLHKTGTEPKPAQKARADARRAHPILNAMLHTRLARVTDPRVCV